MSVHPDTTIFSRSELGGGLLALTRQLRDGGAGAPPDVLPLVVSLQDLLAAAQSALGGRIMKSPDDRESLRDDLRRSIDDVGPGLAGEVRTALHDLKINLGELPNQLLNTTGATLLVGHAENLLQTLGTPQCAAAAWHDVVSAFTSDDAPAVCEARMAQLRALLIHRGHDWAERAAHFSAILHDRGYEIAELRGETPPEHPLEPAGTSETERLQLCASVAQADPPNDEVVVWFGFANARLHKPHLRLGPLDFYDSDIWDDERVILEGKWPRPPELDALHRFHLREKPGENGVLLRVALGRTTTTTARARARQVAESIPTLVSASSGWRLMEGEAACIASQTWFGHSSFEDPRERAQRLASIEQQTDPTGIQLRQLSQQLIDDLISQNDAAAALADGYRWHAANRDVPGVAQRVAFAVQSLERQFVPADESAKHRWHTLLNHYLASFWAWRAFYVDVCDVASSGLSGLEDWMQGGNLEKYNQYRLAFISDLPERAYRFHPDKILQLASELAEELPTGLHRKVVLEAADWARDSAAATLHLQTLERRFDVMLRRAIRIRNAVTHGGHVVPAIADSVDRFTFGLEALILSAKQWALVDRTTPVAIHQRWRLRALHARALLDDGTALADALTTFAGQ